MSTFDLAKEIIKVLMELGIEINPKIKLKAGMSIAELGKSIDTCLAESVKYIIYKKQSKDKRNLFKM